VELSRSHDSYEYVVVHDSYEKAVELSRSHDSYEYVVVHDSYE